MQLFVWSLSNWGSACVLQIPLIFSTPGGKLDLNPNSGSKNMHVCGGNIFLSSLGYIRIYNRK